MEKAEQWRKHIEAQGKSGLSQGEYCARKGLSLASFGYWRQRLSNKEPSSERFVSLPISGVLLEVVIGSAVIRIPPGSDLTELRRVVEALS